MILVATVREAGDAGQCVAAILETLGQLKKQPLEYELWCLFTDGEEFGLWGGHDFVKRADFPWGDQKPVVINFDARGNRGAVLLYETHTNNLRAMQIAAGGMAAPKISTSLMAGVYKRLPNATDFTEFLRGGWCGWNLAVVDGAEYYHTPEDTIENLSPRSIQHFAAHADGLLRRLDRLSDEELTSIDRSEPAVFFDLLGVGTDCIPGYVESVAGGTDSDTRHRGLESRTAGHRARSNCCLVRLRRDCLGGPCWECSWQPRCVCWVCCLVALFITASCGRWSIR